MCIGKKCVNMYSADNLLPIQLAAISNFQEIVRYLQPWTTASEDICARWTVEEIMDHGSEWLVQWEIRHGNSGAAAAGGSSSVSGKQVSGQGCNVPPAEDTNPPLSPEDEKRALALKDQGNQYYIAKEYRKAIECYTQGIRLHGNNHVLWGNRSACFLGLNDVLIHTTITPATSSNSNSSGPVEPTVMSCSSNLMALRDAEICRSLAPQWAKGCYRLAMARLANKQFEDAAVAAFEGCKLEQDNKELKALLVNCVKMGQEDHKAKQAQSSASNGK